MQTPLATFLGSVLVCTLFTTAFAGESPPIPDKEKPGKEKPGIEWRIRQLEQHLEIMQKRVTMLEDVVYQTPPICPCFVDEEIESLPLESCVVTPDGALKGQGGQISVSVGKDTCTLETPKEIITLPVTPQEQWACLQPLRKKMAAQALPCSVE